MEFVWLALEQSTLARAVRSSFVIYPLINAVHILSIGALVTSVILMDLRLLGRFIKIDGTALVRLLRPLAIGAFAIAVLSGSALFSVRAQDYAQSRLFWMKLGLILVAACNFMLFSLLDRIRADGSPPLALWRASIWLSLLVWPSILIAGRFLGFV